MGKYLNKSKPKSTADVSLPPSSSHLLTSGGVCTRAKTLALHRLRHPHPQVSHPEPDLSFLQLRNRRLHKTKGKERERKAFPEDDPQKGGVYPGDCVAASFGENETPEFDARDRRTRESTPCSSIGGSIAIPMPGSTTRRITSISSQRIRNDMFRTTHEIEDFFSAAEEEQRKSFIKKYNFDIRNDMPLAGRYEWLEVMP